VSGTGGRFESIGQVVRAGLCVSCGACAGAAPAGAITLRYAAGRGMPLPEIARESQASGSGETLAACPGKGYPIARLSAALFGTAGSHDLDCGAWRGLWAARTTDASLLERATSGGMITAIAAFLLESGEVDGAVVTRFAYGPDGPRAESFIARSRAELLEAQGSKYCPASPLLLLPEFESFPGRLAFVGSPCQIAALRLLQQSRPGLSSKIPYALGMFCGGFRDLREMHAIIRRQGFQPGEIVDFSYRGGGQPGFMRMRDARGGAAALRYPDYARQAGFMKQLRCRLCVDATAELADISCGDAWLPRFLGSGSAWSLVMARSESGFRLLEAMIGRGAVEARDVSLEELKASQKGNLASKKTRQHARRQACRWLGVRLPEFDGGFRETSSGVLRELRVLASEAVFAAAERAGLYPPLARMTGRMRAGRGPQQAAPARPAVNERI
jgi:coenzyme F420 hydrogenase subunit beta